MAWLSSGSPSSSSLGAVMLLLQLLRLAAIVHGHVARSTAQSAVSTRAEETQSQYDYVIVGGGTAGLTVADRLTESGKYSVLVIEYGELRNTSSVTAVAMGFQGLIDPANHFNWSSVPQKELNGRRFDVIVGKMLGGGSGHNGFQMHRGQKDDYDRWASYFDAPRGWGWDGLLPSFKKAWNFHPPSKEFARENNVKFDASYWGRSSNVHAMWPTVQFPFLKHEIAAFGEIPGVGFPPDSGAGEPGAFWYPHSADPATVTRSFSRTGHWDGIADKRKNYHTLTGHKVLTVDFSAGGRAEAVTFVPSEATSKQKAKQVKAKKEIILAAGTFHTPQILQRSGVGAKKLIKDAGLDLIVDLPGVGSNLQDHPFSVGAIFNLTKYPFSPSYSYFFDNATWVAEQQAIFDKTRTGYMGIAFGNAAAFLPFKVIAPSNFDKIAGKYEAQDPAAYLPAGADLTVVAGYQAQKRALAKMLRSPGAATYNLFVQGRQSEGSAMDLHPLSRGTVAIDPKDPFFSEPIVDFRSLSNPADLDVLVEFTRFTRRFWTETSMRRYGPVETWPGADVTTPEGIHAALRETMWASSFHPIGTAAMMPRALGGVVDQAMLVYGVKQLSVVDASVFPDLPGAYTQQTVYAVAEKAADIIKVRA